MFVNLLSNALKYTPEGGEVAIRINGSGEYAEVTVTDTGIGIPQKDLPLIFERFYRTDISRTRLTGGTGIGLTIARSIVRAHGGDISVESELGKGSCFKVILPEK